MSDGLLEGLSYFIKPDKFDEFVAFCKDGKRDANGKPVPDPNGLGLMTGVIHWLQGLEIFSGNFFTTKVPAPMFCASLPKTGVPWLKIPGFMTFVIGGNLTVPLPQTGEIKLESRRELDDALIAAQHLFDGLSISDKETLKAALQGQSGTDLTAVVAGIEKSTGRQISDLL